MVESVVFTYLLDQSWRSSNPRSRTNSRDDRENRPNQAKEFQVGDKVLEKVGEVAYKLELPQELSRVHNIFPVSNLKKCYADEPLAILLDGHHFDDKLQFVEELVEIMDREVKWLKRSRIPLVKVAFDHLRDALSVIYLTYAHSRGSVSTRCKGYIGGFVLGCHAKDMVALLYIPEPEHPKDLVPAEDEAHMEAYITELQHHPLLPSGTPPLLPIPLPAPSTSRRADIPEADMPPRKRLLLTAPRPGCEVGESSDAAAARQP
ncbi:hypothetical protein Tco_1378833 [Tanacetum coccineum]